MHKYFSRYAEPEIGSLADLPACERWDHVLVVPACNETPDFLRPLPAGSGRALLILVINQAADAPNTVARANRLLAQEVHRRFDEYRYRSPRTDGHRPDHDLRLFRDPNSPRDILLVDRFSPGRELPARGGVGHARKIGADLAVELFRGGRIRTPWIHCSDGDVRLPADYFDCTGTLIGIEKGCAALVYPFRHEDDPDASVDQPVLLATHLYEFSLHYYVAGLRFAGSPYAFHTIGSTMAVHADYYVKVRGFPRREAGEDFYLLNKLAKVGRVRSIVAEGECDPMRIAARRSDRVPFGTGAAVNTITALPDPVRDYLYYHPANFEALRFWLQSWPTIWKSRSASFSEALRSLDGVNAMEPDGFDNLVAGLREAGTVKALDHAFRHSGDFDQFVRQMHTWFDAFRTLKLIHHLRERGQRSVNFDALSREPAFRELRNQDDEMRRAHSRLQDALSQRSG